MRDLRLPLEAILAEDLSRDVEILSAFEEGGAHDDLVSEDGLVMVCMTGAVRAVVAVDGVAWRRGMEG